MFFDVSRVNFSDGFVAIGKTSQATSALDVNGTITCNAINSETITTLQTNISTVDNKIAWNKSASKIYYNGGEVGIGKSDPQRNLDVLNHMRISGDAGALDFGSTSLQIWKNPGFNELRFKCGQDRLIIKENGNVGIGIDPNYNLDIIGNVNFTGNLTQDGQTFISGETNSEYTEDLIVNDKDVIIKNTTNNEKLGYNISENDNLWGMQLENNKK